MTSTTRLLSEFREPTKTSERAATVAPLTTTRDAPVLKLVTSAGTEARIPAGYQSLDSVAAEFECEPAMRDEFRQARSWVADTVLAREPLTLRMLRLRKGLSQAQLAEVIGTRQPYIARIEGGGADIRLDTCRRLAVALDVDLNTLDLALQKQGAA